MNPPDQPNPARAHALVVGGTGMLRDLCLALAARGLTVSVVAQSRPRLDALARAARGLSGSIAPLPVDYAHAGELRSRLRDAASSHGPITLGVCWIHDDAPHALETIAQCLPSSTPPPRLFHILGSSVADPARAASAADTLARSLPHLAWRRVVLGFKIDRGRSRWLTHQEIWQGILSAIDNDWSESVIGLVRPWSSRPGA